jgi:GH24 family phage-related lysozyme (muramidase)
MTTSQWDFTAPFEGIEQQFYKDTTDNVTIGVGFLVPTPERALALLPNWPECDVRRDFKAVAASEPGHAPVYYRKLTAVVMTEVQMREEFARLMGGVDRALRALFPAWDRFPEPARVALLDMGYNLGTHALRTKWPHLRDEADHFDWPACALQCLRDGVGAKRNLATHALFLDASKEQPK